MPGALRSFLFCKQSQCTSTMARMDRRSFLALGAAALTTSPSLFAEAKSEPQSLQTPYKLNRLVLGPSNTAGSTDEHFASDPCVLRNGNQWAFFYFGLDKKGVARELAATGLDLFHATKPLIDVGAPGSVDGFYAHKPSVVTYKGDLYHFYCAVGGVRPNPIRGISVARFRAWTPAELQG